MAEPVSLDMLKAHLRLDQDDTDEDAYLTALLLAARRACEKRINRSIIGASDVLVLDRFPGAEHEPFPVIPIEACRPEARRIALDGGQVLSITAIQYYDRDGEQQTLPEAAYFADLVELPAVLAPNGAWPETQVRPDAISISFVVSPMEADDLAAASQAILLVAGNWYRNREAAAVDVRGTPTELPLAVTWLLEPLRQWATE